MDRIFPAIKCATEIVGVLAKYHTPVSMIDKVLATAKDIAEASTIVRICEPQDTEAQSK